MLPASARGAVAESTLLPTHHRRSASSPHLGVEGTLPNLAGTEPAGVSGEVRRTTSKNSADEVQRYEREPAGSQERRPVGALSDDAGATSFAPNGQQIGLQVLSGANSPSEGIAPGPRIRGHGVAGAVSQKGACAGYVRPLPAPRSTEGACIDGTRRKTGPDGDEEDDHEEMNDDATMEGQPRAGSYRAAPAKGEGG